MFNFSRGSGWIAFKTLIMVHWLHTPGIDVCSRKIFGYFPGAMARNECKVNVFAPLLLCKIPTIRGGLEVEDAIDWCITQLNG